ncbi:MAG: uncharacterized protein QOF78_2665 [Phycisphaerales bacterium]|jgi:uncharacterized membrane protein (UPF0127 family)|nr:uncharacterized protein [Phycisphaerales bacterium]
MTRSAIIACFVLSIVALLAGGCGNGSASSGSKLPTVPMQLGTKTFTLEIANDAAEREKGLMRRDSMSADHGMIFVFPGEERLGFYMRNTRIPLDIVFINANGVVVSVKQMRPYDANTTYADAPAKWAIELNQGQAAAAGVKVGDQVSIPEAARNVER